MSRVLVGMDIGGSKCAVILATVHGGQVAMLGRQAFATAETPQPGPCLERLCTLAHELLRQHGRRPDAAGISCGGPLDSHHGLVLGPPNLPGWDRVDAVALVSRKLGCPARLENDANLGALAEWRWGAGRGCRSLVFLTMGTGLGAGIILDGRLWRGACDLAGESGHVRLAADGPEGYGKRGSFEGFCSGGGIARWARSEGLAVADAAGLFALAQAGDVPAQALVARVSQRLGEGIAVLVDLLNPECVAIGGIFPRQEVLLRPGLEAALAHEGLPAAVRACRVVPACLGEAVGDYAAVAAALEQAP